VLTLFLGVAVVVAVGALRIGLARCVLAGCSGVVARPAAVVGRAVAMQPDVDLAARCRVAAYVPPS